MTAGPKGLQAFRGSILHCLDDPDNSSSGDNVAFFEDGILLVENGHVAALADAETLLPNLPDGLEIVDYTGRLILPGLIDTHVHFPQTDMIASYGEQLLDWLEKYAFPAERRFADADHAAEVADFFLDELLRNGTTTALVLGTVHPQSVDAIFEAASAKNLRLAAGKVLMDRNCPEDLRDDPESAYHDSKALIERWHRQGRLLYAITPRFAPTSTEAQLERTGQLAAEHPDTFLHSHLAENKAECAWVAELFPESRSYLDVYDRFGLLRERSVFAHCIHLDQTDRKRMAETGAAMAFCPSANLFLGSGLFDLAAAKAEGARVGLGTDVGAGTSFNLLRGLSEAYKILQLNGQKLAPFQALYLATLAGARALHLDDKIGNFDTGKEADFVVLDWRSTPLLGRRTDAAQDHVEKLFALIMLGDDRAVFSTYIMGRCAYRRAP
ncbi:MAG: guanine deaminase [Alphaproteobacteria bacterium]|nr:guanine deaminase [Alphaproteobacteria bacterium]